MIKQEKIQETLLRLCKHYGEQNWWQSDNKIEDLVSTILIQRTTEKNAKLALAGLMDVMTVEDILALPLEDLQERIRPAGGQRDEPLRGPRRLPKRLHRLCHDGLLFRLHRAVRRKSPYSAAHGAHAVVPGRERGKGARHHRAGDPHV